MENKPFIAGEVSMPLMRLFREHVEIYLSEINNKKTVRQTWIENLNELSNFSPPEIIFGIGYQTFNNPIIANYINNGMYQSFKKTNNNDKFDQFSDTLENFNIFGATPYVIVVDLKLLNSRPIPKKWSDLTRDEYHQNIVAPGIGKNVSSIIQSFFEVHYGSHEMTKFNKNIKQCMHGSQVAFSINKNAQHSAISILPLLFARCIVNQNAQIIIPGEGVVMSPMWLTTRKDCSLEAKIFAKKICYDNFAKQASKLYFPFVKNPIPDSKYKDLKLLWTGWDFIYSSIPNLTKVKAFN